MIILIMAVSTSMTTKVTTVMICCHSIEVSAIYTRNAIAINALKKRHHVARVATKHSKDFNFIATDHNNYYLNQCRALVQAMHAL